MLSGGFGWPHLLIILLVVIVLFGAKRLPDAARGVGKSLRIFKSEAKAMRDDDSGKGSDDAVQNAQQQLPRSDKPGGTTAPSSSAEQQRQNDVQN